MVFGCKIFSLRQIIFQPLFWLLYKTGLVAGWAEVRGVWVRVWSVWLVRMYEQIHTYIIFIGILALQFYRDVIFYYCWIVFSHRVRLRFGVDSVEMACEWYFASSNLEPFENFKYWLQLNILVLFIFCNCKIINLNGSYVGLEAERSLFMQFGFLGGGEDMWGDAGVQYESVWNHFLISVEIWIGCDETDFCKCKLRIMRFSNEWQNYRM